MPTANIVTAVVNGFRIQPFLHSADSSANRALKLRVYGGSQNIMTLSLRLSSRARREIRFRWLSEKADSSRQEQALVMTIHESSH